MTLSTLSGGLERFLREASWVAHDRQGAAPIGASGKVTGRHVTIGGWHRCARALEPPVRRRKSAWTGVNKLTAANKVLDMVNLSMQTYINIVFRMSPTARPSISNGSPGSTTMVW